MQNKFYLALAALACVLGSIAVVFHLTIGLCVDFSQKIMNYLFDFPHGPKVRYTVAFLLCPPITVFYLKAALSLIVARLPLCLLTPVCVSVAPSLEPPTGHGSPTLI